MISLCLIVRDEEERLRACIESALPAVDEVVVVDTGSTDRTVEIARSLGARCFRFAWRDDFSAARNHALDRARGDWILVLDADERLEEGAGDKVRAAAADGGKAGYFLRLVNFLDGGKRTECLMLRFFVNRPEIRYRYLIHEQVLPDLLHHAQRTGEGLGELPVRILHDGYLDHVMKDREKTARNRRLFLRQLALYPRDLYSWYKYAEFLRYHAPRDGEVLPALGRAWELFLETPERIARTYPFAGEIAALLGLELKETLGDPQAALAVLEEGTARCLPTPHLYFVKAGLEAEHLRFEEALRDYRRCLEFHGRPFPVPVTEGVTSWKSLNGMGNCFLSMGDTVRAAACFEASLRERPDQAEAPAALAEIAYRRGDLRDALARVEAILAHHPANTNALRAGAAILRELGEEDRADRWERRTAELERSAAAEKQTTHVPPPPGRP